MASLLGPSLFDDFGFLDGTTAISADNVEEAYLNNTWRPCLTITGVDGLPSTSMAGNVI